MKRQKISAKVCILGDAHSGKSTFANCGPIVRDSYIYTKSMGLNIYYHGPFVVKTYQPVNVNLLLWELTSPQSNASLRHAYLRGCAAVFILCDMSVAAPFANAVGYIEAVRKSSPAAHIYLVANKLDLVPEYDFSSMEKFAVEMNISPAQVSTITGQGAEPLYLDVAQRIALRPTVGQDERMDKSLPLAASLSFL